MQSLRSSAAVIITRPPNTIACAIITGFGLDIFVIFDSRPRPSYPFGSGLILSTSIDQAVARLQTIFPAVGQYFLSESDLWRARLLNNVSSSIFVSNKQPIRDIQGSTIESGPVVLWLQAEMACLKQENAELTSAKKKLEEEVNRFDSVQTTTAEPPRLDRQESSSQPPYNHTSSSLSTLNKLQQSIEDIQLVASTAHSFSCAICMDEQPMDNTVELECNHPICRDCIRGHICSKIEERRFPVHCPVCMMEQNDQPGVISRLLVQLIGVDERNYAIWEEMELSQHSVLIHCRRCRRSAQVDKEEHEASEVLTCPLPDCNYVWCKACQRPIATTNGSNTNPPHSCDGAAELRHLMQQQGWKFCPNCKIPVERIGGCRHMSCTVPGCNTHFCYDCGECIIRSTFGYRIQGAVNAHHCSGTHQLFDVDNDNNNNGEINFMRRMVRRIRRMTRRRA
ncbi:hypothetical protein K503DRAFT_708950 [Rhizopogon vinicolor AM-OR11-026]|uniref:RBR-type E3 ubiquitin transferase n=1 Tax=Rhizopogon vinicolor AM-OR11-026 TaxID=1314800 RepID=A0A1B7NEK9_9AGAM|nr:hypothetical protein K503DRAFT_708950 [Rhizopogon vinicolor AM-OR11-026]